MTTNKEVEEIAEDLWPRICNFGLEDKRAIIRIANALEHYADRRVEEERQRIKNIVWHIDHPELNEAAMLKEITPKD